MNDIDKLHEKIDELSDELIDLTFQVKNSKETELLEFVRDLFLSLQNVDEKLSKEEIVENLKNYINEFAKNNKLRL